VDRNYAPKMIEDAAKIERIATAGSKSGRVIMATGRGGTGKSTFVALASRYLKSPLLLLDIDPDQSLGSMLGIELESATITTEAGRELPVKTLSDLTSDIEDEDAFFELGGGPPHVKIPLMLQWYTHYRSERFDLMSIGPKWTEGDYRSANYLFEFIIPSMGKDYATILIDSPAGLEHLNRRVVSAVDDLFIVVDPSGKSVRHVNRVKRITGEVGIRYKNLYLVGNHEFNGEADRIIKKTGETYLGKMDYDSDVKTYNLQERSLLELPEESPACLSVRRILEKAGYEID